MAGPFPVHRAGGGEASAEQSPLGLQGQEPGATQAELIIIPSSLCPSTNGSALEPLQQWDCPWADGAQATGWVGSVLLWEARVRWLRGALCSAAAMRFSCHQRCQVSSDLTECQGRNCKRHRQISLSPDTRSTPLRP